MSRVLVRVGQVTAGAGLVIGGLTEVYAGAGGSSGAAIPALFGLAVALLFGVIGGVLGLVALVSDPANKRAGLVALGLGLAAPLVTFGLLVALVSASAFRI